MAIDLGKQIGPLPVGAWVVVVGAGVGFALLGNRSRSGEPEIVEDVGGVPGVGTGPGWVAVPPPSIAPVAPSIETNDDWARQATNWLIAQNYDPAAADLAVRKYVNGDKLSVQEYALIRIALMKFGALPYGIPVTPDYQEEVKPVTPATPVVATPPVAAPAPAPAPVPAKPAPIPVPVVKIPAPAMPAPTMPVPPIVAPLRPIQITNPFKGILTPINKPSPKPVAIETKPDGSWGLTGGRYSPQPVPVRTRPKLTREQWIARGFNPNHY